MRFEYGAWHKELRTGRLTRLTYTKAIGGRIVPADFMNDPNLASMSNHLFRAASCRQQSVSVNNDLDEVRATMSALQESLSITRFKKGRRSSSAATISCSLS